MIGSWSPREKQLRDIQLGALGGIIALGIYGILSVGPYSIIGSIAWAPHAYNWVIWGSFGILISFRWKVLIFPALFMIYAVDEIIWTSTFVLTTCAKDQLGRPWLTNGAGGYFAMIIVIGAVTWYLIRPGIRLRSYVILPWLAWFLAYVFIFHIPIVGNECLPNLIPGNLGWEILWQFTWLGMAAFTFYPASVSSGK
jgi:hypothetical protein